MSYRQGLAIGESLAGIGGMIGGIKRQQADTEILERERRVKGAAHAMGGDPNYQFGDDMPDDEKFDALAYRAKQVAEEQRNTSDAIMIRGKERAEKWKNLNELRHTLTNEVNSGNLKNAAYVAAKTNTLIPNNVTATVEEGGDGLFIVAKNVATGETKNIPWNEETAKQAVDYANQYRDEKFFDDTDRTVHKFKIEKNFQSMIKGRKKLIDKNTKEVVGYEYEQFGKNGSLFTDDVQTVRKFANGEDIPADQLSNLTTVDDAEAKSKYAKSQYETKLAEQSAFNLDTVDPKSVIQNQAGGYTGETRGGSVKTIPTDIAREMLPKEDPKYNMVQNETGEYTYLQHPDQSGKTRAIGTGVKSPAKEGDGGKVYTVKNPVTRQEAQLTGKEIRANLKEAKAMLKDVKDDNGNSLLIPDYEAYINSSKKEKETVIGRIKRIAENSKNPPERAVAGQVLGYLEALGISKGSKPSWKDLVSDDDKAAVMGNR